MKRAEIAIDQIRELEEPLTLAALEKIIKKPWYRLKADPQLQNLLQDVPKSYRQYQRNLRENDLLTRVRTVKQNLQVVKENFLTLKLPITQRTICEYIGLPLSSLRDYPEVASHIKQILEVLSK